MVERLNRGGYPALVPETRRIDGKELPGHDLTLLDHADDLVTVLHPDRVTVVNLADAGHAILPEPSSLVIEYFFQSNSKYIRNFERDYE